MTGIGTTPAEDVFGRVIPRIDGTVVELHGDLDLATIDMLQDCLAVGVERGGDLLVDLADVTLLDGAALSVLVRAGRVAQRRGQRFQLMAPSSFVRRILAAAELGEAFAVIDDPKTPAPT
jgi:anti-anti-sigma factor